MKEGDRERDTEWKGERGRKGGEGKSEKESDFWKEQDHALFPLNSSSGVFWKCLIKTCSALRIAVGLYNQLLLMLLVQNGIYESDYAAYQQTAHADNRSALSVDSHLQNNMYWLRSRVQQNAV